MRDGLYVGLSVVPDLDLGGDLLKGRVILMSSDHVANCRYISRRGNNDHGLGGVREQSMVKGVIPSRETSEGRSVRESNQASWIQRPGFLSGKRMRRREGRGVTNASCSAS